MKKAVFAILSTGLVPALLIGPMSGLAQVIPLRNPSFEDQPGLGKPPFGWFFCGNAGETPPDVHPGDLYGVAAEAKDGQTYVGMVTRDNDTQEQIGQRLPEPLAAGKCYYFRIFAARSEEYASFSKKTRQPAQYTTPLKLAILGARRHCEPTAVLALSEVVANTQWQQLEFMLQPAETVEYLLLTAASANGASYNGNILVDAASPLIACDCEQGMPVLEHLALPKMEGQQVADWLMTQQSHLNDDLEDGILVGHLFETSDGVVHYVNRYFRSMVQVLKTLSGARLSIEFNPVTFPEASRLAMQMDLDASGLSFRRYSFKARPHLERPCHITVSGVK